eukprot:g18244.t1
MAISWCDGGDTDEECVARVVTEDNVRPPRRGQAFWTEPFMGICVVGVLSTILIALTYGATAGAEATPVTGLGQIALTLIWAEAGVAVLSTLYLLFGNAGVVQRSEKTCYPIPSEVESLIKQQRTLDGLKNIPAGQDHPMHDSYCVRCCLWRPRNAGKVHHCNVCQRCVTGFDHHCGVFGRCIVRANMPCFLANIGMMFAGMVTAMMALMSSGAVVQEQGM